MEFITFGFWRMMLMTSNINIVRRDPETREVTVIDTFFYQSDCDMWKRDGDDTYYSRADLRAEFGHRKNYGYSVK